MDPRLQLESQRQIKIRFSFRFISFRFIPSDHSKRPVNQSLTMKRPRSTTVDDNDDDGPICKRRLPRHPSEKTWSVMIEDDLFAQLIVTPWLDWNWKWLMILSSTCKWLFTRFRDSFYQRFSNWTGQWWLRPLLSRLDSIGHDRYFYLGKSPQHEFVVTLDLASSGDEDRATPTPDTNLINCANTFQGPLPETFDFSIVFQQFRPHEHVNSSLLSFGSVNRYSRAGVAACVCEMRTENDLIAHDKCGPTGASSLNPLTVDDIRAPFDRWYMGNRHNFVFPQGVQYLRDTHDRALNDFNSMATLSRAIAKRFRILDDWNHQLLESFQWFEDFRFKFTQRGGSGNCGSLNRDELSNSGVQELFELVCLIRIAIQEIGKFKRAEPKKLRRHHRNNSDSD